MEERQIESWIEKGMEIQQDKDAHNKAMILKWMQELDIESGDVIGYQAKARATAQMIIKMLEGK